MALTTIKCNEKERGEQTGRTFLSIVLYDFHSHRPIKQVVGQTNEKPPKSTLGVAAHHCDTVWEEYRRAIEDPSIPSMNTNR
jgi:hypothetical protein